MVTIKDIANDCGVGITTVSNILNNRLVNRYGDETRRRVLEAARIARYRPNRTAQAMRAQRTQVITFMASNIEPDGSLHNFHTSPFIVGMSHFLTKVNYHVGLIELTEMEIEPEQDASAESLPRAVRDCYFDGMVVNWGLSQAGTELVLKLNLPIIWWDTSYLAETDCIRRDERAVARTLTERLIDLGHRRICVAWHGPLWDIHQLPVKDRPIVHFCTQERYDGYCDAMKAAGLEPMSTTTFEGSEMVRQMSKIRPTAVITSTWYDNYYVMNALSHLGLRVPEDVSIATCDVEARFKHPVAQPGGVTYDRYALGQTAAEMILTKIEGHDHHVPSIFVTGKFIIGETIARLNDKTV
jgi:DNA-binding LacI/PurR family transcriptional regulator